MRITQGAFSYLPDLTDEQIEAQLRYALNKGWAIMFQTTDDPHPRNILWDMWSEPMFDLELDEVDQAMHELAQCRDAHPHDYVRVVCYDRSLGYQTTALSFIVGRPETEPGFDLIRQEKRDRQLHYTLRSYAADQPPGRRYGAEGDLSTKGGFADEVASQDGGDAGSEDGGGEVA